MTAKITLTGMTKYMLDVYNVDIFEGMELPDDIDKDLAIDTIMFNGGEFEVLYADPYTMASAIKNWSKTHYRTFDKWKKALDVEYNPLENYDRNETEGGTTNTSGGYTSTLNNTTSGTTTTTDTEQRQVDTDNDTTAFNSNVMQPDTHTKTLSKVNSGNIANVSSGTSNGSDVNTHNDNTQYSRNVRIHGNIGVTTSQQMLQSELDIARFNLYEQISDLFIDELLIPIYI